MVSLGGLIREIKGRAWQQARSIGGLQWQAKYYDHVLRGCENPITIAQYVINNPVRKDLIDRWDEWPWTYVDPDLLP